MRDPACVDFLRWALPRLRLRWEGFRRVRRQVCRRVARRTSDLGLPDAGAYRAYLEAHPEEWERLDAFCRIPISRFHRDRGVFEALAARVLPALAARAGEAGRPEVACWSAGCASGEEPYTLAIVWALALAPRFPGVAIRILATDVEETLLARARAATYRASSLKELSRAWIEAAFDRRDDRYRLRERFRADVVLARQDLRREAPPGPFDLILCRNVALTYFDDTLQRETLRRLIGRLRRGGALVIGAHERLPEAVPGLAPWERLPGVFRRSQDELSAG